MERMARLCAEAFSERHPGVSFTFDLRSTGLAMPGLAAGTADLGLMGRDLRPLEVLQFSVVHRRLPIQVEVATGAFAVEGKSWPLVVFVHRTNPIEKLTLAQLDGIFGGPRSGGWDDTGTEWVAANARGPEGNIRTWGQLGISGEWSDKPVTPYGFDISSSGSALAFGAKVFGGGDMWSDRLVEVAPRSLQDQSVTGRRVVEALSRDRYGIAFAGMQHASVDVKAVAIQSGAGPFVLPTTASVASRRYPLARSVYMVFDRNPAGRSTAAVTAFANFVLSPAGQALVAREGEYLPLRAELAAAEREKLARPATRAGLHGKERQ